MKNNEQNIIKKGKDFNNLFNEVAFYTLYATFFLKSL